MNDTENTTEASTTKKSDNAPDIKKDSKLNEPSSKSNLIIPLVLLLVSAIVIVVTFYETDSDGSIAQNDTVEGTETSSPSTDDISTTLAAGHQSEATTPVTETAETTTENPATGVKDLTTSHVATEKTNVTTTAQTKKTDTTNSVVAIKANANQSRHSEQPAYIPNQRYPYTNAPSYEQARQQTMARSTKHRQERARQRDAMMQQRREAYERELQARRLHVEAVWKAAMQAQQKRRAKIAETRKAVFQRIEQNRVESRQRLQEMHKRISEMHEEIHQMMRDSLTQQQSTAPAQLQSPSMEQM